MYCNICPLLQRLDLRDNNIQVEGLKSLKESISKSCRITRLDLDPLPRNTYAAVRYCFSFIIFLMFCVNRSTYFKYFIDLYLFYLGCY